jgi:cytidylate kinase
MIKVLTFDREYGSGAAEIAQQVAERLGWKLWDESLTNEVARRLECESHHVERHEERRDPLHYRIFKAFLRGSYEGSQITPQMKMADAENIRRVSEEVVRRVAAQGNAVIVGRGSAYYLRDQPDSFHVFIYAPFEEKVRRLQQTGKSEEEATQLVQTVDKDRADFIRQNFGIQFPARHFFHLMVNSTIGETAAVQTVLDALSAIQLGAQPSV